MLGPWIRRVRSFVGALLTGLGFRRWSSEQEERAPLETAPPAEGPMGRSITSRVEQGSGTGTAPVDLAGPRFVEPPATPFETPGPPGEDAGGSESVDAPEVGLAPEVTKPDESPGPMSEDERGFEAVEPAAAVLAPEATRLQVEENAGGVPIAAAVLAARAAAGLAAREVRPERNDNASEVVEIPLEGETIELVDGIESEMSDSVEPKAPSSDTGPVQTTDRDVVDTRPPSKRDEASDQAPGIAATTDELSARPTETGIEGGIPANALGPVAAPIPDEVPAAPDAEGAVPAASEELKAIVEALIFASPEPLTPKAIFKVLDSEPKEDVQGAIEALEHDYQGRRGGLQLIELAGGYQIVTRQELSEWVRRLFHERKTARLSVQALETLAVIAYKQPVTAAEIAEIRGVNTAGVLSTLVERKLIKTAGRKPVVGRPFLYATTREFLIRFGLNDLSDLPKVEEMAEALGFDLPSALETGPSDQLLPLGDPEAPPEDGGSAPESAEVRADDQPSGPETVN